jgi:hypothetical protein
VLRLGGLAFGLGQLLHRIMEKDDELIEALAFHDLVLGDEIGDSYGRFNSSLHKSTLVRYRIHYDHAADKKVSFHCSSTR